MKISKNLINWYLSNFRPLPWRETNDPYKIWLSEIVLQQTRVEQGMDYYLRFINTYPKVEDLAAASEDEVLKLWQGLGYYSRARNLHFTAKHIQKELKGKFPESYEGLLKLKGVGAYTAAAIASFAFQLPHAVVDGNVSRVLSRLFDVGIAINSTEGAKIITDLADECLDRNRPDLHNQAMMELGAMVCTPRSPDCGNCPLSDMCLAFRQRTQASRPVKIKKVKQKLRYIHYAVLESENELIFRKRGEKDIWQGLHDFVSIEGVAVIRPDEIASALKILFPDIDILHLPGAEEYSCVHQLTHQRIEAKFWRIKFVGMVNKKSIYLSVSKDEVETLAVPRLVHKYLEYAEWLP